MNPIKGITIGLVIAITIVALFPHKNPNYVETSYCEYYPDWDTIYIKTVSVGKDEVSFYEKECQKAKTQQDTFHKERNEKSELARKEEQRKYQEYCNYMKGRDMDYQTYQSCYQN